MHLRPRKHLSAKARSQISERRARTIIGGKLQPASGAIKALHLKGDVKSAKFLLDDKTTHHSSFSITRKLWEKLAREAWGNNRRPALRVHFDDGPTLYVVDEVTFMEAKMAL